MAYRIKIPEGKKVTINKNGEPLLPNTPLILDDDVTISLSSSFSPFLGALFSSPSTKTAKIISSLGAIIARKFGEERGVSTQLKQFGIQTWDSTDPISLNLTFSFFRGLRGLYDAKKEVYDPIMTLCELPLPSLGVLDSVLTAPGPTGAEAVEEVASLLSEEAKAALSDLTNYYSIRIGNIISISGIVILKAEPTFTSECDERGYPIWGQINLDINSIETATVDLLREGASPVDKISPEPKYTPPPLSGP